MRINNNLMAMNTHRQLGTAGANGARSMEKLSSGFRINKAGDDAAGLSISEKMRGQIRGLNQASRNAQDGISLIQTAEGALNETHAILQRMRELGVQAGNDTNTDTDRGEIQKEMNQLTSEINRIGNTTEFNTQKLLKGGASTGEVTVAPTVAGVAAGTTPAKAGKATAENIADLGADVSQLTGASLAVTVGATTFTLSNADIVALKDMNEATAAAYIADKAVDGGTKLSTVANVSFEGGKLTIESTATGTGNDVTMTLTAGTAHADPGSKDAATLLNVGTPVTVASANEVITTGTKGQTTITIDTNFAAGDKIEVNGKSYTAVETGTTAGAGQFAVGADSNATATSLLAAIKSADNTVDASSSATTNVITLVQATASTVADPFAAEMKADYDATLQIGSNQSQTFNVNIRDMRSVALGLAGASSGTAAGAGSTAVTGASFTSTGSLTDDAGTTEYALDVSNSTKASAAVSVIDQAIEQVSAERSKLGAFQNRLEHTIKNLDTSSENLQASESRIRDVDMAKEMMEFTKNNILQQAAQAMLAQANQAPQGVLQLLR